MGTLAVEKDQYYSVKEVGHYLGVSVVTIYDWIKKAQPTVLKETQIQNKSHARSEYGHHYPPQQCSAAFLSFFCNPDGNSQERFVFVQRHSKCYPWNLLPVDL